MISERKRRQQEITAKLIQLFDEVLDDSRSTWLSYVCCSNEEKEKRKSEDEYCRNEFLSLLEDLVKVVK